MQSTEVEAESVLEHKKIINALTADTIQLAMSSKSGLLFYN